MRSATSAHARSVTRAHRLDDYVTSSSEAVMNLGVFPTLAGALTFGFVDWIDPAIGLDVKVGLI